MKNAVLTKKIFFLASSLLFVWASQSVLAEPVTEKWLEPEIIDHFFDSTVGVELDKLFKDRRIAIKRVPVFDDVLDKTGEISPFDFELGFTLANKYLWRGQNLANDTSWMPYVTVSPDFEPIGDLSFTFWMDLTKAEEGVPDDKEYDFVIDYSIGVPELLKAVCIDMSQAPYIARKLLDFTFSTGYIYYYFPPGEDSHEVYFKMDFNWPLHPYVAIYNDFDDGSGVWYEYGISQDFDLRLFTLSTFVIFGYNHRQWGKTSSFSTMHMGGSIPFEIGPHMVIEPFISYSKRLKRTYTDDREDLVHDEFYYGFNYTINF